MSSLNLREICPVAYNNKRLLEQVFKWKILSQRSHYHLFKYLGSYNGFIKKVGKLKKSGLIESGKIGDKLSYLYLSNKCACLLFDSPDPFIEETAFMHDLLVSRLVFKLKEENLFDQVTFSHEERSFDLNPDAVIEKNVGNDVKKIALELELTQKSRSRIMLKFDKYLIDKDYSSCIYIFTKERDLKKYLDCLQGFREKDREKFWFGLCDDLESNQISLRNIKLIQGEKRVSISRFLKGYEHVS